MAKVEPAKQKTQETETSKAPDTEGMILNHVGFSMVAGAIPVPLVDIVAVSAIQMDMLGQLAKAYNVDFNVERGKSLAGSIMGAGLGSVLGRLGASAVKAIPGVGTILGIASQVVLAGASTYALGKVFEGHFASNGTMLNINLDEMRRRFDSLLQKGKEVAEGMQRKQSEDEIMATIEKLKALKDKGAISDEEFKSAKKDLLSKVTK